MFGIDRKVYRNGKGWELRQKKKMLLFYGPESPVEKILRFLPLIPTVLITLAAIRDPKALWVLLVVFPIGWVFSCREIFPSYIVHPEFLQSGKRRIKIKHLTIELTDNEDQIMIADNFDHPSRIYIVWEASDSADCAHVKSLLQKYIPNTGTMRLVEESDSV